MEPDTSRRNRGLARGRRLLWVAPTFVVLWLSAIQIHLEPVFASLDSSWLGALSYFAARRLQYGTEVIFTYGPLAYLGTGVYTGYLFWERVIWELGFKAVMAGFLCWVIGRLPRIWGAIFLGLCLLFVLPGLPEVFYFLSVTILVVFLLREAQGIHFADILAIMLLSAVSLMKHNYLILVLLGIGAATTTALLQQNFARAAWICGTFLAGVLLCWKWASQDFRHLVPYLRNGFEVSFGYKEAMGVAASSNLIVALGLVGLIAAFVQLSFVTMRRRELGVTLIALFFAGEMFLDWQHGFIRADQHVVTFFALCPVALLSLWATGATGRVPKWPLFSTTAVVACACLGGMYLQDRSLITHCFRNAANQLQSGWDLAFHGARIEEDLKQQLAQKKAQSALPRVKQEVGQASIDVLGYEQAAALLNDLNYTPRPIFQSYTAYTERLIEQNRRFYQSARAPAYALVKYQTIDSRYPALDDAAVFRELLYHYSPLFTENGYSLWKRLPRSEEAEAVVVSEGTTTFGQEVIVPQSGIVWIELQMQNSIQGKIANMFYKPPRLLMTVGPGNGPSARYRLVRAMASSGFIISPSILTTDDLIATSQGGNSLSTRSFIVWLPSRDRKFYQPAIRYRMTQLPPIPRREP